MKYIKFISLILCLSFLLVGCMDPNATGKINEEDIHLYQLENVKEGDEIAVIETTKGTIKMVLYTSEAPNTVAHFKKLIDEGFYNGKAAFVDKDYPSVITGSIDEMGIAGELATDDGKPLTAELSNNLCHIPGAVSALGMEVDYFNQTIHFDSRFFIVADCEINDEVMREIKNKAYPQKIIDLFSQKGGIPEFTGTYTVFGQVYEGMDVVNEMYNTRYDIDTRQILDDVKIIKVTYSTYTDK